MPSAKFSSEALPDLKGKVYLVTGGNAGIGKATVIGLASHGARVYIGVRNETKANETIDEIKREVLGADIRYLNLDLSSFQSVVLAAKGLKSKETALNGLVNNAGIMGVPFSKTADGYDVQFQTNYLGHWLLTHHLLPLLLSTAELSPAGAVRIVNVTSDGHSLFPPKSGIEFADINLPSKSPMTRYGQSKLANILHVNALNRRFGPNGEQLKGGKGIWVASVHPGHIDTNLNTQSTGVAPSTVLHIMVPVMRCLGILTDQAKGALSSLFAIASDEFTVADSGKYVVPYAKFGTPSQLACNQELEKKLWNWTVHELESKGLLDVQ